MKKTNFLAVGFMSLAIALGAGFAPVAQASTENSVTADTPVLSRCGEHYVAFSGTATYNGNDHKLLADIDGVAVYSTFDEPTAWSFMPKVAVGTHTMTVRIHDLANDTLTVADAITFEVKACEEENDGGDGHPDCCPGPDPVVEKEETKTPTVKGATTTSVKIPTSNSNDLSPLNSIFRFVFGKTPTFEEWKYWADRFLTDKPNWVQILGAMQWHNLHGLTIGK